MVISKNIELAERILKLDGRKVTISSLKNLSIEVTSNGLHKAIPILDKKLKKALDQCRISGSKKVKVELSTGLQQQLNSYIRSANTKNGDVGTTKKKIRKRLRGSRCNSEQSKPLPDCNTKLQKSVKNKNLKSQNKERSLKGVDAENSHFNNELKKFDDGSGSNSLSLGRPGKKLIKAGFSKFHIWLKKVTLVNKIKQHGFDSKDLRNLPKNLNNPIMVFDSTTVKSSKVVLVENKRNMVVAIHLKEHKKAIDIYDVVSIHIREDSQIIAWAEKGLLRYADKKKAQKWLMGSRCNSGKSKLLMDYDTKLQKPLNNKKGNSQKRSLEGIDYTNNHFNQELDTFKKGERKGSLSVGYPGRKLIKAGFSKLHIWLYQSILAGKLKKHNFKLTDLKNLPKNINNPIMVFDSANVAKGKVVLVENKRNMVVAIHLKEESNTYSVASIHIKEDDSKIIAWAEKGLLRYADKKKVQKWLLPRSNSGSSKLLMDCITKIQKPSQKQKRKSSLNGTQQTGLNISDELFTRADRQVQLENVFTLPGEIGSFLGNQQRYRLAIALLGDKHTGKSEFKNQLINAFLKTGLTVGHFDLEHGGLLSKDTQESMDRNIPLENRNNLAVTGDAPKYLETVKAYANKFDVVVIDSWQKLNELNNLSFDSLRIEHPNTIWVVVFQLNASGGTRGGNSTEFNAPVVLKAHRIDKDFNHNYVEIDKNRGNRIDLIYKIADMKVMPLTEEVF